MTAAHSTETQVENSFIGQVFFGGIFTLEQNCMCSFVNLFLTHEN